MTSGVVFPASSYRGIVPHYPLVDPVSKTGCSQNLMGKKLETACPFYGYQFKSL